MVIDVNGLELGKGDTVAPISGDFKGKICALKSEEGQGFVCVRVAHRPYSKGIWYASEHVQRLQVAKVNQEQGAEDLDSNPADKARKSSSKPATKANGKSSAKTAKSSKTVTKKRTASRARSK